MKIERNWGWPIVSYLFLGGLGGGMMVMSTIADLYIGRGSVFAVGNFVAAVLVGLGSGLLIFDLGRPLYFWRVFSREKAILTVGAWMLSLFIVIAIMYGSCWLSFLPWYGVESLRLALAWVCLLLGLGVLIYTGVFLGTMKARPFWNGPALPVLFLVSGLSTGIALQSLLVHFWPLGTGGMRLALVEYFLRTYDIGLLVLEVVVLMVYVLTMRFSTTVFAARAAATWLNGSRALLFLGGMVVVGLILPLVLYLVDNSVTLVLAPIAVLIGGLVLRFLVVYTDDRTLLPGEEKFFAWLPDDDEPFLHTWEE